LLRAETDETESCELVRDAGLAGRPDPHSLALSRSCADVPPLALGGGEASVDGRSPSRLW